MKIRFSGTLLRFVDFQREHEVPGDSIHDGLESLATSHPQLRPVLYDGQGQVRTTHRLFKNGEQVLPQELAMPVAANDTVEVLTAIAGG